MRQSSTLLRRSRSFKHTYRHRHALSTASNGMGHSDVASPKDTFITHLLDWGVVGLAPNAFNDFVHESRILC